MDKDIIGAFDKNRENIKKKLALLGSPLDSYEKVIRFLIGNIEFDCDLDSTKIKVMDFDPSYDGTLLIILGNRYRSYWVACIDYGSCSVCDTLQAINNSWDGQYNQDQVSHLFSLMLNFVQKLRQIDSKWITECEKT